MINAGYLHPVLLAKQAATLDYLSGGRFHLGISIGGSAAEYASLGVNMKQRVGRVTEGIGLMRRLWAEDGVALDGRYFHVEGGNLRPSRCEASSRSPSPPAKTPCSTASPESPTVGAQRPTTPSPSTSAAWPDPRRRASSAATRDAITFSKVQGVSVHASHDEARRRAAEHWQRYYGPPHDIDHATVYGNPDKCVAALSAYAGIDTPSITLILEPTSMSLDELALLNEVRRGLQT